MRARIVVMGVAGSGKSTVGKLLARELAVEFADADEFHPPANIAKMAAGTPLDDDDRWSWLDAIGRWLEVHDQAGGVVTCSALKRRYRDLLRGHAEGVYFLYLAGSRELMGERVADRSEHFMPAALVASQFDTLEAPDGEPGVIEVDSASSPRQIVVQLLAQLHENKQDNAVTED